MKTMVLISLVLAVNLLIAQDKPYNTFDKEAELQKFAEQGGKYDETAPNIYKFTYRTGETRIFNFNITPKQTSYTEGVDTTIINVWEIDTLLYYHKFSFWQKVNIINQRQGTIPFGDNNNNGKIELYGFNEVNYPFVGPVVIYEQDTQGKFREIYTYDSNSVYVQGIGDVDYDGKNEINLRVNDTLNGKFYKADDFGALPTSFDFIFYYYPNQIEDVNFSDYDKNHIIDCSFIDGSNPSKFVISEYRQSINNFNSVFEITIDGDIPEGTAIGDFDQDGKTELVFGTALGKMFVIEVVNENNYSVVYQGFAPAWNAYMFTQSDDIDKNGKPEFWVGGQDFSDGVSRFICYEATADNSYIPVAYIELRYLVSFYANYIQAADMDNDGTQELIINLGNYLIILKFSGSPNYHSYEIFYAKINELTQIGAHFYPATLFDANLDNKTDILLPMDKYVSPNTLVFSYFLVRDTVTSINDNPLTIHDAFYISQNYPNPFNLLTQIRFTISDPGQVIISIYNSLGKEIKMLLNKSLSVGEYTIQWDAKNDEGNIVPTGIYFIQMKAETFTKTIKTVLLK